MPCSGPFGPPAMIAASAARASASARSSVRWTKACSRSSSACTRSRQALVSSTGDSFLRRSAAPPRRSSGSRRSLQILLGKAVGEPARPCGRAACARARPSRRCRQTVLSSAFCASVKVSPARASRYRARYPRFEQPSHRPLQDFPNNVSSPRPPAARRNFCRRCQRRGRQSSSADHHRGRIGTAGNHGRMIEASETRKPKNPGISRQTEPRPPRPALDQAGETPAGYALTPLGSRPPRPRGSV